MPLYSADRSTRRARAAPAPNTHGPLLGRLLPLPPPEALTTWRRSITPSNSITIFLLRNSVMTSKHPDRSKQKSSLNLRKINIATKTVAQILFSYVPFAAHAETPCVFIPRPCPPVGSYSQQITNLRMRGVSDADIKKYTDQAWKVVRNVPGARVDNALEMAIKLSGNGCDELPPRIIGKEIPYPIATPADLYRYPHCRGGAPATDGYTRPRSNRPRAAKGLRE